MKSWGKSFELLERNTQWIPGGVVSLNRKTNPNICFTKGRGSREWDLDGNTYIDYQVGFQLYPVSGTVRDVLSGDSLLMAAGLTEHESILAELFCRFHNDVPWRSDIVTEGFIVEEIGRIVLPSPQLGLGIEIKKK